MRLVEILPWLVGLACLGSLAWSIRATPQSRPGAWRVPAALAVLFLAWSIGAVLIEGPLGFWPEHTRNLWGNQIWFDLLLAAGCAWFALLPRCRAAGMQPWLWLALVATTGSIGLLLMLARLLWLEEA